MKKKSNDILVYIGMAFLALLIIVPPVLRVAVPKEAVNNNPVLKDKVVLLTCNKTSDDGSYQINSKTKFLNGEANTVTLTYKVSAQENTDTGANPSEGVPADGDKAAEEQTAPNTAQSNVMIMDPAIDLFRNLVDTSVTEDANHFTVVLTKETLQQNSSVSELNHYFNLLPNQKKYYEGLGYTCTKLES